MQKRRKFDKIREKFEKVGGNNNFSGVGECIKTAKIGNSKFRVND